jgi:hypothetical protein
VKDRKSETSSDKLQIRLTHKNDYQTRIVKTSCLLLVVFGLFGCSGDHFSNLSPTQATDLAQQFANEKAEALYSCRPFSNGPPAQLVDGHWTWRTRRGQGQVDLEASVEFATNGANPSVSVVLMDSRARPIPERLR